MPSKDSLSMSHDGDMSVILEGIYVARHRACRSKDFLLENGITHIINCAAGSCESMFRQDFVYLDIALKDEPKSQSCINVPAISLAKFIPAAAFFIQECLDNGGRVVVHCRKGISRSVSIVAGYLMYERGSTLTQALTMLRERRITADPNVWFVEDLRKYQAKLDAERLARVRASHAFERKMLSATESLKKIDFSSV